MSPFARFLFQALVPLALMGLACGPVSAGYNGTDHSGKLVSLDYQDADLVEVLKYLGEAGGYNVVIYPEVKGSLTLKLKDVPWELALTVIARQHGLGYKIEGNVLTIFPLWK